MSFLKLLIPATISCLCNTIANTLWKLQLSKKPFSFTNFSNSFYSLITPNILGGICFYIFSMLLFFFMLSNFKLSAIIPITSLTYIFNIIAAVLIFKENINIMQATGTVVIIIGLLILSRA